MIALPNDLPLIRLENGESLPFEPDWLIHSLARAARRAGITHWWLAPHVAASVAEYLRTDHPHPVIESARLQEAVCSVLQVIGYAEVGHHFTIGLPKPAISLVDLARQAGTGYELAFFDILRRRLLEVLESRTPHFSITGLDLCVKILRSRKVWCRECATLKAEIVLFARRQITEREAPHDVSFTLT